MENVTRRRHRQHVSYQEIVKYQGMFEYYADKECSIKIPVQYNNFMRNKVAKGTSRNLTKRLLLLAKFINIMYYAS